MSKASTFNKAFIQKIANLSKLELKEDEDEYFASQFNKTLETISELNKLDTNKIPEAYNITGLKNVFRDDVVDSSRVLTQDEALSGAKRIHNGFFVVKSIIDEKHS